MANSDRGEQLRLQQLVGIPKAKMFSLLQKIQDQNVRTFSVVESEFLDVMWTLDSYRMLDVIPMRDTSEAASEKDLKGAGAYRSKGNFFSEVMTNILSNKTTSSLAARGKVQGFSQYHQIDVAWPNRRREDGAMEDPLICCEAKLSGAPGINGGKPRGGYEDFSNRRKEMKFQATDLKLQRNRDNRTIYDWDQWRKSASPFVYSLWAARLDNGYGRKKSEQFSYMIAEAQTLMATYSDGVGVFGYRENGSATGYVAASAGSETSERVVSIDSVLSTIAAQIRTIMDSNSGAIPAPRKPVDSPSGEAPANPGEL